MERKCSDFSCIWGMKAALRRAEHTQTKIDRALPLQPLLWAACPMGMWGLFDGAFYICHARTSSALNNYPPDVGARTICAPSFPTSECKETPSPSHMCCRPHTCHHLHQHPHRRSCGQLLSVVSFTSYWFLKISMGLPEEA